MAGLETAAEKRRQPRRSAFTRAWKFHGNLPHYALGRICAVLFGAIVFTLTVWLTHGAFAAIAAVLGQGYGYTPWQSGLSQFLLGIVVSAAYLAVAPERGADRKFSEKLLFYTQHHFMPPRAPTAEEMQAAIDEVCKEAGQSLLPLGKVLDEVAFRLRVRTYQTLEEATRENDSNNRKRTVAAYVFALPAGLLGLLLEFSVDARTGLHSFDCSLLEAVRRFI